MPLTVTRCDVVVGVTVTGDDVDGTDVPELQPAINRHDESAVARMDFVPDIVGDLNCCGRV
jgi:hypothetical protein